MGACPGQYCKYNSGKWQQISQDHLLTVSYGFDRYGSGMYVAAKLLWPPVCRLLVSGSEKHLIRGRGT